MQHLFSMRFLPVFCLALLALPFSTGQAHAQSGAPTQKAAEGAVQLSFSVIGMDDGQFEFSYLDGSTYRTLETTPFTRSRRYNYKGPATLTLYHTQTTDSGAPERVPAGSVRLPSGTDDVLLLLFPDPTGKTCQLLAINNSEADLPRGSARIFNATGQQLAIKAGDAPLALLAPGQDALAAGNGVNLPLQVASAQSGDWKIAASSLFGLKPNRRMTIFLTISDSDFFRASTLDGSRVEQTPIQIFTIGD